MLQYLLLHGTAINDIEHHAALMAPFTSRAPMRLSCIVLHVPQAISRNDKNLA
jgi:hypothetical protein